MLLFVSCPTPVQEAKTVDKKQYPEDPPSAPLPDYYCYWSTDGNVYAMQMVGNTLYLGGNFSKLYPNTGYGVI